MKALDIRNIRKGMLVAKDYSYDKERRVRLWRCVCDCGNEKLVRAADFKRGAHTSCGCKGVTDHPKAGDKFVDWTVLSEVEHRGKKYFLCRCRCGYEGRVSSTDLRHGNSRRCRSCGLSRNKKDYGVAAKNAVVRTYTENAAKKGRVWSLSDDELDALFSAPCHYCNVPPYSVSTTSGGEFVYNGLDRVDNDRGYEKNNVVPCCVICNRAKRAMPYEAFWEWIEQMRKAQTKRSLSSES